MFKKVGVDELLFFVLVILYVLGLARRRWFIDYYVVSVLIISASLYCSTRS